MRFMVFLTLALLTGGSAYTNESDHMSEEGPVRPPDGWIEFCKAIPGECMAEIVEPVEPVVGPKMWETLIRVNTTVNRAIEPMSDQLHWGVVEKWSYPDDGFGDCEDYVLLKRRLLLQAGWPRSSLLVTVVRQKNGEGHAVLTAKTDIGDFILDNLTDDIVMWWQTSYRFVKRQARHHPGTWMTLGSSSIVTSATK